MEGTMMALPRLQDASTQDERGRLDQFLADLSPTVPVGIELEPVWEGNGWTIWVKNHQDVDAAAYDRFVDVGHELAERHGVGMSLMPVEMKYLEA
jgi:hypothetical protein